MSMHIARSSVGASQPVGRRCIGRETAHRRRVVIEWSKQRFGGERLFTANTGFHRVTDPLQLSAVELKSGCKTKSGENEVAEYSACLHQAPKTRFLRWGAYRLPMKESSSRPSDLPLALAYMHWFSFCSAVCTLCQMLLDQGVRKLGP